MRHDRAISEIQPIIHRGRTAALLVAGHALILDALPSQEHTTVTAMCLYALEVAEGRLRGHLQRRAGARVRADCDGQAQLSVLKWLWNRCARLLASSTCPSSITRSMVAQFPFGLAAGLLIADPVPITWKPKRRKGADER